MTTFLGCKLKVYKGIEFSERYELEESIKNIAVISISYFPNNLFDFDNKKFGYLTNLIQFIETFQYKIDLLNTLCKIPNTTKWILRVYIDKIVFDITELIDSVSALPEYFKGQHTKDIVRNIALYKNIYSFINTFLTKYIDNLETSSDPKYRNIEIYGYHDIYSYDYSKINLYTPSTFGTLLRFHPLVDNRITHCIMRNCSFPITMLDLFVQKHWIEQTDLFYMAYGNPNKYIFKNNNNIVRLQKLYKTNKIPTNYLNTKHSLKRFFAGLFSSRISPEFSEDVKSYLEHFNETYIKPIFDRNNNNVNNSRKFAYGIDEIIMTKLFKDYYEKQKLQLKFVEHELKVTKVITSELSLGFDKLGQIFKKILKTNYKFTNERDQFKIENCNILKYIVYRNTHLHPSSNKYLQYKLQGTYPFVSEGEPCFMLMIDDTLKVELLTYSLNFKTNYISKIIFRENTLKQNNSKKTKNNYNKSARANNKSARANNKSARANNSNSNNNSYNPYKYDNDAYNIYDTSLMSNEKCKDLDVMYKNPEWIVRPLFKFIEIDLLQFPIDDSVNKFIGDMNEIYRFENFYPIIQIPKDSPEIIDIIRALGINF